MASSAAAGSGRGAASVTGLLLLVLPLAAVADEPKPKVGAAAAAAAAVRTDLEVVTDLPELVAAHNAERAKDGLPPLEAEPRLADAARRQALDMAAHETMAHEGSDGSTPAERVKDAGYHGRRTGENVAAGYRTVSEVVEGWMNSPPHRANILGEFSQIGVARAVAEDGEPYWAVAFGEPWPEPDPDAARDGLLTALNAERQKAEAPALARAAALDEAAQRHAEAAAKAGTLEPKGLDERGPLDRVAESGYAFRRLGQTVGSGQATAEEALRSWLRNEDGRERLLDPAMTEAGIGYARGADGVPYWSLILAEPRR